MSAIGPADHERFCRNDEWDEVRGTGHGKWEKRLPDDRLLRTVVQRHKADYGRDLKSRVLSQLEVDESTFWNVVQTGNPAPRPAPAAPAGPTPIDDWIIRALEQGRLNESEIAELTPEEAAHLAITYFSIPQDKAPAEVRQLLLDERDSYRHQ